MSNADTAGVVALGVAPPGVASAGIAPPRAARFAPGSSSREFLFALLLPIAATALLLLLWQLAVRAAAIPPVILPAPSDILRRLVELHAELIYHARYTGLESIAAFAIATVLGIAVALALSSSTWLREAFYPNLVLFQLIPKIALAPLFVLWLGIEARSRLTFAVFVSFFPVAIAMLAGLDGADRNALRLCQSLNARAWQTLLAIRVPFALPYLFSGIKIAATMAFIGVVVGEFISARAGLGYYILFASSRADTAAILASISVLCVLGLALYGAIELAERAVRRRWRE